MNIQRRAFALMNKLADRAGVFGNSHDLTPLEEEALNILMDLYPKWQPGDEFE